MRPHAVALPRSARPPARTKSLALPVLLLAGLGLTLVLAPAASAAPCTGTEVQGSVFHDFDADGVRSAVNTETGVPGAVVTAYSGDGSVVSCETLADGAFGFDAPSGGFPVRVEVTLPAGGIYEALEPGASGNTSVFFVDAASTGWDVGFNVPTDFCQDNPDVMATCFLQGDPLFPGSDSAIQDTVVSVDYDRTVASPTHLALGAEVGAVWGLAYQRSSESLFVASVLRRHAGFGPLGIGGIYRIDYSSGSPVVSSFLDVGTLGIPVGTDPRTVPGEDPPGNGATGNEPGLDNLAYEEIGKVGLGDLDLDEDTGRLWLMNLGDGNLYAMDLGLDGDVPTSADLFPLPTVACTDGVFRPWAVKVYRGRVYIGGVCSNENISPYPPQGGFIDFPNLVGYVYSMDPADGVFSLELTLPLNYPKGCAGGATGCQWYPWTDLSNHTQVATPALPSHPTPILSDLEFADDGDMIVGITDRTGFQYGTASPLPNGLPTDTTVVTVFAGGDRLRADFDPTTGNFTLESNGTVGGLAGAGAGNLQGPGGGEYYSASTAGFHFELSQGGYAVLRGSNEFVGSAMDPATINSGGLLWMHEKGATPGAKLAGYTLFDITTPSGFRKGAGIGDVELRCDAAPIELGNRVWCDAPMPSPMGDGIQGPTAPDVPLAGVTVDLSCDGGSVTASTVTDANGLYLFGDGNVTGGIPAGVTCTLSIDTTQGALGDCNLPTLVDAGGNDPGADLRDSDGSDPDRDGVVSATVAVGGPGSNDHSIDFGFTVPSTVGVLGDTVWCDGIEGLGNGVFDAGEGIPGVTVELYEDTDCDDVADGGALTSLATSGDGQYLFTDLLVGPSGDPVCYVVRLDAADPDLGTCTIPATPLETSPDLDLDGIEDLDNDFALLEPATIGSVGDTVWCDGLEGFGNGAYDAGEGLAGITVDLLADSGCDGVADGGVLDSQPTVGDGQYLFTGLLVGQSGSPICYVARVDTDDPELGVCTLPLTATEAAASLDLDAPEDRSLDFAFLEPCLDPDGDRLCNESCRDDRDGDGIADCDDFDPQGYFYCEDTGKIVPGGLIDVVGPGTVTIFDDGSSGRYAFLTDGTPGTYSLVVTPPDVYPLSTECPDLGILDPTGFSNPLVLGSSEQGDSGFLGSKLCGDNPFFLTFELEPGDPFILDNNIPLGFCAVPPTEVPTASGWGLLVLFLLLGLAGAGVLSSRR